MSRQITLKKYRSYTTETMQHAVQLIQRKSMSLNQAAASFNIPKSTLSNKVNQKTMIGCKSGPSTVLTADEEATLLDWAVHMAKIGFGRTRNELLDTVKVILDKDGRPNPFTNNRPGKDWYYAFIKRHPQLSERTPQQLAKERAVITPKKVEKWFQEFCDYMAEEVTDTSIWNDPSRWYNADESGFPLCPKSGKVLSPKGVPNIYNFTASDKTQVTVLACMNASGYFLKPMIVYPGVRFNYNPLDGFSDAVFGRTESGWMDSELFVTWLTEVFEPSLSDREIKRPVVLFVDGHSTHCTLEASKFCRDHEIILYCLLEHASHLLQPCDLKLFSSLKEAWKQSVRDFQITNVGEYVTKAKFASVFKTAWEKSTTIDIAIKAFRDSGLFPMNPKRVLGTLKMEPSMIFEKSPTPAANKVSQKSAEKQNHKNDADSESTTTGCLAKTQQNTDTISNATDHVSLTDDCTNINERNTEKIPHPSECESIDEALQISQDSSQNISPTFTEVLKIPKAYVSVAKNKTKRVPLPKAISGKKFHDLLEQRKLKKAEEIAQKEARKIQREERKKEREELGKQKQKEKEEKRIQREKRKQELKRKREVQRLEKEMKKKQKSNESDLDSTDEENENLNISLADDDMDDVETYFNSNRYTCYSCEQAFDGNTENWITCHNCPRWLHRACVKTIDLLSLTEAEIADSQFECDYC